MAEEGSPKKRLLSRWDWLWLIIAIFILLTIGLERCGVNVIQRTEDSEIRHKPHQ